MPMSKNKIKIKGLTLTATEFAKKIKRKWLIYFSVTILVIFFIILLQGGNSSSTRVVSQPSFKDLTPENTNEVQLLRDIQRNLREIKEQAANDKEKSQRRENELAKEIEKLSLELNESNATKKEIEQKILDLEIKSKQAIETKANANSSTTIGSGNVEVPEHKPSVPPPPPIYLEDQSAKENKTARSNLPSQNIAAPGASNTKSIVITGGKNQANNNDNNVLVGTSKPVQQKKQKPKPNNYLPEGSFVDIALLTGADFGAGKQTQSNPQPTVIRLQSDAVLPGMASYKLKSCFAIGNGYGELSSHRAHIQVSRLSCVQEGTGNVLSAQVLGFIVDSDGKLGLRGTIQRRQGMLMGKALLAGFAEGIAKVMSVAAQNSESVITGAGVVSTIDSSKAAEMAGWSGFENAMSKLADRYIEEADSIFPVIEINPGRRGALVFQNGQNLEWKTADEI